MSEPCRFEPQVLRAAAEDRWTAALREHLGDCDDCVAAMSVAPWMTQFTRIHDREHRLPDPAVIWLKAKLLQGVADVDRVSRPMDIVQLVAYAVVAGGWAGLLLWRWDMIEAWLRTFTPFGMVESVARAETLSVSFFALLFVLASMTVMVALHTILAEE
ncbi:MAG TPA: hypothetical protein VF911_05130 [Thermoanaerobaculia bacterium]